MTKWGDLESEEEESEEEEEEEEPEDDTETLAELLVLWKVLHFVPFGAAVFLLLAKSHIHLLLCRHASGSCNARPLPHLSLAV